MNDLSMRAHHEARAALVADRVRQASECLRSRTSSASNLYRYGAARLRKGIAVDLRGFNDVIALDAHAAVLQVEGATPYETIVNTNLPASFLPTVTPELKQSPRAVHWSASASNPPASDMASSTTM